MAKASASSRNTAKLPTTATVKPAFSWDAIDAARSVAGIAADDCPPGAFTVEEYATKYGIPRPTAEDQCKRMVRAGALKTGRSYGVTRAGRHTLLIRYWPA
jgi:hypothetical protein